MYHLYIAGKILALVLPRRLCYGLANFCALIHFRLSKEDRETIIYNLTPIVGEAKAEKYAKEVFINFAYYLADFFRYSRLNQKFIKKYVRVSGLNNLDQALAHGKGVIALTAHLGNYELAGAVTSLLGYPVSAVALPHKDRRANELFDSQRQIVGVEVISTGGAIKGCLSALKKKRVLALLGDRDFSKAGYAVKILSRTATLPRGPAYFALKTGACIIPGFLVRENKFFYHLIFEKPFIFEEGEFKTEVDIVKHYVPVLEKYIEKYPEQWYMFQKLWID